MTPKDVSVELALGIAVVAVIVAQWVFTKGPLHVAAWIIVIGAVVLATTKFSSQVLG